MVLEHRGVHVDSDGDCGGADEGDQRSRATRRGAPSKQQEQSKQEGRDETRSVSRNAATAPAIRGAAPE